MLFGLVVTSFVHIGGVFLVFTYLIVPAVCANYLATSLRARLIVGWVVGTLASVASLLGVAVLTETAKIDLPIGAAVVCGLGVALAVTMVVAGFRKGQGASPPSSPHRET